MPYSRRDPPFTYDAQTEAPVRGSRGRLWVGILMATVAGVGALGAYLYYFQRDVVAPYLKGTPIEPRPTVTQLYKWQDADGVWQVSDRPPPQGTPFETLELRSDVNILPVPEALEDKQ